MTKQRNPSNKKASPAQEAVRLYGRRLFSVGSTTQLIKTLRELGFFEEAEGVKDAMFLARTAAKEDYEFTRLRLDPNFETSNMRRGRELQEYYNLYNQSSKEEDK